MTTTDTPIQQQISDWFENLIADIRVDQIQVETGVADTKKMHLYHSLIAGKEDEVLKNIRAQASQILIERVIKKFIVELASRKSFPEKLAFALTPSTIMVWAEIRDDDERVEDGILLAEAEANAFARQYNLTLDTMIVETSDGIAVPPHYSKVKG